MANETNHIDELITRVILGEASPEDQQAFDRWIKNPGNEAEYARIKRTLALASEHLAREKSRKEDVPVINVDDEWNQFAQRVGYKKKDNVRSLFTSTWVRVAAALLFLVTAGIVINLVTSENEAVRIQTLSETKQVTLPDGSVVTLNRNSSLSYTDSFNEKDRSVELSGEAFFDVTPNKAKPFIITSGAARVEVVGTSFNVSAFEGEQVTVSVETGVVRISQTSSAEVLELRRGEAGMISRKSNTAPERIDRKVNYRSWATRHIEFNATPLKEIVQTLNSTYGANIVITGNISGDCVVTTVFDQQTLDEVLRVLESTLELTYRINGNTIEIISAKC